MKKNWLKKLSAALFAATLFTSGLAVTANAANETITKFDETDFQELTGLTTKSGSLTVQKYMALPSPTTSISDDDKPVNGVEITIKRVGEYATVVDENGTASVLMGISKTLLDTVGMTKNYANAPQNDDYVYLTSAQYDEVNEALQTIDVSKFDDNTYYETAVTKKKTGENAAEGTAVFTINDEYYGIYLVRETSVEHAVADVNDDNTIADNEYVAFKKKQYPYLVSVPAWTKVTENGNEVEKWTADIEANAKNDEVEVDIEKFIERENDASTFGSVVNQKKTDVTHVGDTVEFTLDSDIPMVDSEQSSDVITSYEIHDVISNGLTLPSIFDASNLKVMLSGTTPLAMWVHFTIENKTDIVIDDSEPKLNNKGYANGQTFTIKFTDAGLKELTRVAKDTTAGADDRRFVRVSYTATVNSEAIVGTDGNPNKVKLEYASAGSSEITTDFDDVKEFIFSMEGNKTFDGDADGDLAKNVTFELYLDENCTKPVSLTTVNDVNGSAIAGRYVYDNQAIGTDAKATVITLDANGSFSVKGVPVNNELDGNSNVTLYLKETATAPGYNKLTKVVPITLTAKADGTSDEYDGTLASGTVNGKAAQFISVDGEGVAVSAGVTGSKSGISFTVNNTSGFQLPSTGGMGIWMFVIGGMAVIGCGLLYYRRNKSAE